MSYKVNQPVYRQPTKSLKILSIFQNFKEHYENIHQY